jgi:hypothetical protein
MARGWPQAAGDAHRRARKTGKVAAACALVTVAGCSSSATGPPRALPARSHVSVADVPAAARVFVSRGHGYTATLPAGWSAQAAQPWRLPGSQADEKGGVDVFYVRPYAVAWGFAAPAQASLVTYATATTRAAAQLSCPAVPPINQPITIGGAPALLIGMSCPSPGGVLMLTAVTTQKQKTLVFEFEDVSGIASAAQVDRAAFREFLAGIRFER